MHAKSTHETDRGHRDELFEALADTTRRRAVAALRAACDRLTLSELAEELARDPAREADAPATDVERLRIELYHRHLPKLEAAGVVEFDADRRTARLSGTVPEAAIAETERTLEIA